MNDTNSDDVYTQTDFFNLTLIAIGFLRRLFSQNWFYVTPVLLLLLMLLLLLLCVVYVIDMR